MMLITTDQNAGFSGKINAINIYSFPQFFNFLIEKGAVAKWLHILSQPLHLFFY